MCYEASGTGRNILRRRGNPLQLNAVKSSDITIAEVRARGLNALGSHVGPVNTRRAFLDKAIDAEDANLHALDSLPRQDALILLRFCLQHNLGHLLRCLDPEGLEAEWLRRDAAIYAAMAAIRGPAPSDCAQVLVIDTAVDAELVSLPLKLGGLGLLSHTERAPLAHAAAMETAWQTLLVRADQSAERQPVQTQRHRHVAALARRYDALWGALNAEQRVALHENASYLGRRWLSTLPLDKYTTLADVEVSAALFGRSLAAPATPNALCLRCSATPSATQGALRLGHLDTCSTLQGSRTAAHERVKYAVCNALNSLVGTKATPEPFIRGSSLRNDIRVSATSDSPLKSAEYDVSLVALSAFYNRSIPATKNANPRDRPSTVLEAIQQPLKYRARKKVARQPPDADAEAPFVPIILSAGGLALGETVTSAFDVWRRHLPPSRYLYLMNRISCALLTRRVRRAALQQHRHTPGDAE